jgi:hypothetical protein
LHRVIENLSAPDSLKVPQLETIHGEKFGNFQVEKPRG